MAPIFAEKLASTLQVSTQKGKISNLGCLASKKKRSRQELDAVRDVETQLKANRHAFLLEVQRLRQQEQNAFEADNQDQRLLDLQAAAENAHRDRNVLQQQNEIIVNQLQHEAAAKETLRGKVLTLYETLRGQTSDKATIDSIFQGIM